MHFILSLALCSTVSLGYNLQGLEDISNYSPEQTYKKLESVRLKVDNLEQRMESVRVKVDKLEQRMEGLSPTSNLEKCPDGWWKCDKSCYYFGTNDVNWFDALTLCRAFGGYLAEINNASEDSFLWQKVKFGQANFWIGGTDIIVENHWVWVTSRTRITTFFSKWAYGQPDDYGRGEHCMDLRYQFSGWNDNYCEIAQKYICELELK